MRPFIIIDWRQDFIQKLADQLAADGSMRDALVVFPHLRPRRYLLKALAEHPKIGKPFFPPQILSLGELTEWLYKRLSPAPAVAVPLLERAGLLFEVVNGLGALASGPLESLPRDRAEFFPWGLMLAELMEELFRHGKAPGALPYMTGEVLPTAAALLENLDDIYFAYVDALNARSWTTPGLMARLVADQAPEAARALADKTTHIAGFYVLAGAEKKLFKALCQEALAQVYVHADPGLALGRGHWSCLEIKHWAEEFGARLETGVPEAQTAEQEIRFYEAFDLHSQLKRLETELNAPSQGFTAVVLPDVGSLMPVLHHLPQNADVNVSMGYPLARSPLFRLVDQVLRLQESSPGPGQYYWRDVVELIRHPYLKTLALDDGQSMRSILGLFEDEIRQSDKFLDPLAWSPGQEHLPEGTDFDSTKDALERLVRRTISSFERIETLEDLGNALLGLCDLLVPGDDAPENLWQRFPIDGECLFRLVHHIVPQLVGSSFSREPYGRSVVFTVLRKLLEQERVPFEAEPLTGLQVLGWLETRLLQFDAVHVLDASDDKLPGASEYDPLLPDPLRGLLGLPDGRQRDYVAAYNFQRLVAGAKRLRVYYRAGESGTNALAGRSIRSRFAEQLVWQEEQKQNRIIEPGDGGPVEPVSLEPGPLPTGDPLVRKDDRIREAIKNLLTRRSISPSLLDNYLTCQLKFFFERVAKLKPLEEVSEDVDSAELGKLVHGVLQRFFEPYLGRPVTPSALDPEPLLAAYSRALETADFVRRMPLDQRLALHKSGALRLRRYMESNTTETTILGLERTIRVDIETGSGPFTLEGRLDRIDRRADGDHVLDYKTGATPRSRPGFLENSELLEQLRAWRPGDGPGAVQALALAAESVQLPLYLYIYALGADAQPANTAWIELRDKGEEKPFFGARTPQDQRLEAIRRAVPEVVEFLIRHMLTAKHLAAAPGPYCRWCPFRGGCPTPGP